MILTSAILKMAAILDFFKKELLYDQTFLNEGLCQFLDFSDTFKDAFIYICQIYLKSMSAILENGRHFEILHGKRYFLSQYLIKNHHTNFGACIRKWTIFAFICPTI